MFRSSSKFRTSDFNSPLQLRALFPRQHRTTHTGGPPPRLGKRLTQVAGVEALFLRKELQVGKFEKALPFWTGAIDVQALEQPEPEPEPEAESEAEPEAEPEASAGASGQDGVVVQGSDGVYFASD